MSASQVLLDLLFPPKCPFCRRVLDDPRAPLCPDCQPALPWLEGAAGVRSVDFTGHCFSPLAYRGAVPEAVRRYKFQRVRAYGQAFGVLMAQCLEDHLPGGADLVTWAPLSRRRLRRRGFDQAELLARQVGAACKIPVQATLQKRRDTPPQSRLEGEDARRANVRDAYALLPGADLTGRRVVLVDDVVTSGSTLAQCARLLRQAGAEAVYGLTLAQARGDGEEKREISKK